MKKQLRLLAIVLTLIFSIFSFANRTLFQPVSATYVEGPILQDTVWALVDSPFVLSNNVSVYPGVTLTIEPGVKVGFGESFGIIVNGRIVANGEENKMISFTSSKLMPLKGDWGTILIDGTQPSSFAYCVIEYGTNGITVETSSLNLQNCVVKSNSKNGIIIDGGNVVIKNNEIADNTISGIYIDGGSQITVQNNDISSNGEGISLTGLLSGNIDIEQNNIFLNGQTGITLDAGAYGNTVIIKNNISENLNGFRVSSTTSTYITRNYISDNIIGIYYESGNDHEAHFNDIYDNGLGMNVESTASVDATYNYWGYKSGPLHESLNPYGKGNPVGGNGVNLDFIFFLSKPIDYINGFPTAVIWTDKILVKPNQNVTFVGADSYDDGRVDQYLFDFGDGTSSGWTTLPLFNHAYSTNGTYIASLKVIDDFNTTSQNIATTAINVQNLTPLEASAILSDYTVSYNGQVSTTVYVSDGTSAVENATVTLFSVKGGIFMPQSGLTDSTGQFTATFTASNVTETTNVRIIARASKTGYSDGSDYTYLNVLPTLNVQVTAEPPTVKSEEAATVTVYVAGEFEEPVANASLVLSVDQGNLSATMEITDSSGKATFNFAAPQTTAVDGLNATITAIAAKSGYADGGGQAIIAVEPKLLVVQVSAEPDVTVSEGKMNVTVQVTYDVMRISGANVTVMFEDLPAASGFTDPSGVAAFVLAAPPVNVQSNVMIIARASKIGFVDGENLVNVTVSPGILNVEVNASPSTIMSRESSVVTVYTTCNAAPVANATVTVAASNGNMYNTTGFTDSNGYCTFVFNAPITTQELPSISITANATKNGFISGGNQTTITVTPGTAGGWPLTTILLILIPVVIVVIIAVLVRSKKIMLSDKEEE